MKKIVLIGNGKMALALAKSLASNYTLEVLGRDNSRLEKFKKDLNLEIDTYTYDDEISFENKIVLLCVKPYALDFVAKALKNSKIDLLMSILAGVKIENIKAKIDSKHYVRVMPNIASKYNSSMTTLCGDDVVKDLSLDICNTFGNTLWLSSEKELDIATAIAGSGPAFIATIAEAISDAGVGCGLKREDSIKLTQGLFESFDELIKHQSANSIKEEVTSPNGTTAAGLEALEKNNIRYAIMQGITKAYKKTQ